MKVCLLGNNASVHVQKWVKALSELEGMELHVLSFPGGLEFPGVSYHALKKMTGTKLDYLLNAPRAKSMIRFIAPDVLHAHYATSYGLIGALAGFHPYIITGWGADIFDSPRHPVMRFLLKYALGKADAITVLSEITQKEIARYTDKPVELIPFGVDTERFRKTRVTADGLIRIGTVRTLSEKYGVEYLIRAFASIHMRFERIRLEIVGDGPQRAFLERLSKELGLGEKVRFYGYINQHSETERYLGLLNSFDIFAILSVIDSETFGVAAVEASACEIPVLATRVGGLPEVITDQVTGLIVSPRNSEEAALALEKLILDKDLRQAFGKKGREKTEALYNWNKNVNRMYLLYQKLSSGL